MPLDADAVHAVIPVTRAHQWQAVAAKPADVSDCPVAMIGEGAGFLGNLRAAVVFLLPGPEHGGLQIGHDLVEDRQIARGQRVGRGDVGQPERVVGDPGADPPAVGRVPPVLGVALGELPGGRAEDLRLRLGRGGEGQGHHVLQLVAESVGPARLVEGRSRPDAAGDHLGEQPPIQEEVHRRVGRLDLDGREEPIPPGPDLVEGATPRALGLIDNALMSTRAGVGASGPPPSPSRKTISASPPPASSNPAWIAAHGFDRHADTRCCGTRRPTRAGRPGPTGSPLRPRLSARSAVSVRGQRYDVGEGDELARPFAE